MNMLSKLKEQAKKAGAKIIFHDGYYRLKSGKIYSERCLTFWDGYRFLSSITQINA